MHDKESLTKPIKFRLSILTISKQLFILFDLSTVLFEIPPPLTFSYFVFRSSVPGRSDDG